MEQRLYTQMLMECEVGGTYLLDAMNYARQYWSNGAQGHPSPRFQYMQLNFTILISDGQWNNHNSAMRVVENMKNTLMLKLLLLSRLALEQK